MHAPLTSGFHANPYPQSPSSNSNSHSRTQSGDPSKVRVKSRPLTSGFHTNPNPQSHSQSQSSYTYSVTNPRPQSRRHTDSHTPLTSGFHTNPASPSHHSAPPLSDPSQQVPKRTRSSLDLGPDLAFHTAEEYTAFIAPYIDSLARFWNVQDSLDELEGKSKSMGEEMGKGEGEGEGGWI